MLPMFVDDISLHVDASSTRFAQINYVSCSYELAMRFFVPKKRHELFRIRISECSSTLAHGQRTKRTVHALTPVAMGSVFEMDREDLLQSNGFSGGTNIEMLATSSTWHALVIDVHRP
jgi:hypothetical protein